MTDQIPLLEAETMRACERKAPPCELYVVLAFNTVGNYWSLTRDRGFRTVEAAQKSALAMTGQWTNRHIVKIAVGG